MKGEAVFEIRRAVPRDRAPVADMILTRCTWLGDRGLPSLRRSVDALASQCGDGTVWVLTAGGDVVGCTTVLDHGPARDWTEEERKVPALYLFSTVIHPDYRALKPGTLIPSVSHLSLTFGQRCQEAGISPSTGRRGSCYDNAVTGSFFASLETELIDRTRFTTRADAEREVFSYVEGFYNPWRRHSANGQVSPAEYERRHIQTAQAQLVEPSQTA